MKQETNKFKRFWISFWYNDATRLSLIIGLPIAPIAFILYLTWLDREILVKIVWLLYISSICWAVVDNDYSNLRRIGLDEYRRELDEN